MRKLLVTKRDVPAARLDAYDAGWTRLTELAADSGARAWRFRQGPSSPSFLEFIETAMEPGPADDVLAAQRTLDAVAAGSTGEWIEAAGPPAYGPRTGLDRSELRGLFRARSLRTGEFVLASGRTSAYYIDARVTTMSGLGQRLIGRLGLAAIDQAGWSVDLVGGLTLGADPVAYAIAHTAALAGRRIDAFTVRKEAKRHGTEGRIEGSFRAGASVAIVEDVITSGQSALDAAAAVRDAGGHVAGVLTVIDREEGGRDRIARAGYAALSLFTASDLLAGS